MLPDLPSLVGRLLAAPPGHWAEGEVCCVFAADPAREVLYALRLTDPGELAHPLQQVLGFPGAEQRSFHGGPLPGLFALLELDPDLAWADCFRFGLRGGEPAPELERPFLTGNVCVVLPGSDDPRPFRERGATRRIRYFFGCCVLDAEQLLAMRSDGWLQLPARAELLFAGGGWPRERDLERLWQVTCLEGEPLP